MAMALTRVRAMIKIKSPVRNAKVFYVVIVGLLIEAFNSGVLFDALNFAGYHAATSVVRLPLLVFTVYVIYSIKGSFLLWLFMGFNMAAIFMSLSYLNVDNYYLINPFRRECFSPAYRALECLILIRTAKGASNHTANVITDFWCWACFVVSRRILRAKDETL
tara:strand:- start:360 stop:848 length:489 start_codon:yes stop_codon:yes gene_type:complete